MTRIILATAALTAIYALALASANPWDLGIGAMLSLGTLIVFRGFLLRGAAITPDDVLRRAVHLPALVAATAVNIVRGTGQVARVVLTWSPPRDAGFVTIPQGERTNIGVAVSGLLDTLSPGTVLIDIDLDHETWTIHALDASDGEAVRGDADRLYERYQRPVWP